MDPSFSCVLVLDIGSTSVRARLFDESARPVSDVEHESQREPSANGEEDPLGLARATEEAIDGALSRGEAYSGRIAGVGMATFVGNMLGVDEKGVPTTPLYTYAHGAPYREVDELRRAVDYETTYDRTGCPLHTSYQGPRLLWLSRQHPDAFRRTSRWVDLGTFLYQRWFGQDDIPTSYSVASWSGLFDRNSFTWHSPLLEEAGVSESRLPRLADYDEPVGGLARDWARRWPALKDVPFFLAVGDGAAANIGSGCDASGTLALTMGTTGALRGVVDETVESVPRGLWAYRVNRDLSLVGGAITDGGSLLVWLHHTLRMRGERVLDEEIARVGPDGHGLTVLPFLRGERSPGWATEASATVHGLRASTTPADIARAALESVAYRFQIICSLLQQVNPRFNEVVAGGAAILDLPAWMQIIADVLRVPVMESPDPGTTSRGVALLVLKALGLIESLDALPASQGHRYQPNPDAFYAYAEGMARHKRLYDMLISGERDSFDQHL